mgnify:CR=1 FL=1
MPHALLIKFPGTNCDVETSRALEIAGFAPKVVPISTVTKDDLKAQGLDGPGFYAGLKGNVACPSRRNEPRA